MNLLSEAYRLGFLDGMRELALAFSSHVDKLAVAPSDEVVEEAAELCHAMQMPHNLVSFNPASDHLCELSQFIYRKMPEHFKGAQCGG